MDWCIIKNNMAEIGEKMEQKKIIVKRVIQHINPYSLVGEIDVAIQELQNIKNKGLAKGIQNIMFDVGEEDDCEGCLQLRLSVIGESLETDREFKQRIEQENKEKNIELRELKQLEELAQKYGKTIS